MPLAPWFGYSKVTSAPLAAASPHGENNGETPCSVSDTQSAQKVEIKDDPIDGTNGADTADVDGGKDWKAELQKFTVQLMINLRELARSPLTVPTLFALALLGFGGLLFLSIAFGVTKSLGANDAENKDMLEFFTQIFTNFFTIQVRMR